MTEIPEPEDKLDATATVVVSGPEDDAERWRQVDWRRAEADVRRLRQRIFTASKAGDLQRVRRLQKLMLRSRANTLMSVRRVTERNAGRLTAGVDGEVVLTPEAKMQLADRIQQRAEPFKAMPVRRVYIPKPGGKRRPLGIPVIVDRCHQARVVNALEPEWEARFEPKSYGFRPGRGCQDAIQAIYTVARGNAKRLWTLDADLASAFDLIAHDHILSQIGAFPARGMIRQWLKAGVVEQGRLHRTEDGVPQGGVVSPLLLNVALHGMETAAGVRYHPTGTSAGRTRPDSPVLIRYADDLVALCHTRQEALEVKARLAAWLAPRGLSFNEDKTRVVALANGFDFLGFNVRRYRGKLLIKPSKQAVRRIRERLRTELRALVGHTARAVIRRLNPMIRGWANYYRTHVAGEIFGDLDAYLWRLTWKWAVRSHSNKPKSWVFARYFGRFNKARQDRWVFGDRHGGSYMHRFAWTTIVRHQLVKQGASPDDPTLAEYWAERRREPVLPITNTHLRLLKAQDGCCPICKTPLFAEQPQTPSDWARWLTSTRTTTLIVKPVTGTSDEADYRLTHADCANRSGPALLPAYQPTGLA
jgi:RNA-directed DNA polymerase